jgi:hypothetical protein
VSIVLIACCPVLFICIAFVLEHGACRTHTYHNTHITHTHITHACISHTGDRRFSIFECLRPPCRCCRNVAHLVRTLHARSRSRSSRSYTTCTGRGRVHAKAQPADVCSNLLLVCTDNVRRAFLGGFTTPAVTAAHDPTLLVVSWAK